MRLHSFFSSPVAAADYWQGSLVMWAYVWLVRRHLSPLWEDEDGFRGEVRAQYGIKNVSAFCVFAFVLPLARCCCCLRAMEVLVLYSRTAYSPEPLSFFYYLALDRSSLPPPPPPVFRFSLSENKNVITRKSFHPFLQEVHDQQDNSQHRG